MLISKQLVTDILNVLQKSTKVTERVVCATGIAKNTVTKLLREHKSATASGSKMKKQSKETKKGIFRRIFFNWIKKYNSQYAYSEKRNTNHAQDLGSCKNRLKLHRQ